ncbi:MAG: SDR family oxidoreductase [Methanomicrobiales archaeon]|nr:SDR family oxidoreductase [Methanomicrobiales archaeon]
MLLHEKIGLVSGSSRGIGKAIAQRLLKEGAVVWITGRERGALERTHRECTRDFGDNARLFEGDLTDPGTIRTLLATVHDQCGGLDIAVANIGSGRSVMGWDVPDQAWEDAMTVNFHAAVRLSREAIRLMETGGSGSIVFISSIAGVESIRAPVPYAAAKAALLMYMKSTARIVAPMGIRMNAVSPGNVLFEGGTWDRKLGEDREAVEGYIRSEVPMGAFASPQDIAGAVAFLASDSGSFVTGANLVVDGGQTRSL